MYIVICSYLVMYDYIQENRYKYILSAHNVYCFHKIRRRLLRRDHNIYIPMDTQNGLSRDLYVTVIRIQFQVTCPINTNTIPGYDVTSYNVQGCTGPYVLQLFADITGCNSYTSQMEPSDHHVHDGALYSNQNACFLFFSRHRTLGLVVGPHGIHPSGP